MSSNFKGLYINFAPGNLGIEILYLVFPLIKIGISNTIINVKNWPKFNYLLTYDSYGPVHNRFHRGECITWASGGEGALDTPGPLNGIERSEATQVKKFIEHIIICKDWWAAQRRPLLQRGRGWEASRGGQGHDAGGRLTHAIQDRPSLKTHLLFLRLVSGPEATSPSAWQRLSGRPWRTGAWCWRPPHSRHSRQTKLTLTFTLTRQLFSSVVDVSFWAFQTRICDYLYGSRSFHHQAKK